MAVLTARAREFREFLEIRQSDKLCVGFRERGAARGHPDWGIGPVLYGSVQEWICQDRKGWRKYENFKLLRAGKLPPQQERSSRSSGAAATAEAAAAAAAAADNRGRRYVFVGDNGRSEKDLQAPTHY